ncbi:MAG TPA: AsnC family transcriptional regulator [Gammaproteobacteria bacterium]|nr:AsnC family transcriptional regulator [Gammaproteobacteria bacterium]
MPNLDPIDHQLIALLRHNARLPAVKLAAELGVSRATVQNRMDRLVRLGVIRGFTIDVSPGIDADKIRAFMSIQVDGKKALSVARDLRGFPEIIALHSTNGRWDLIAEIRTESLESFNQLLNEVRLVEGVAATETNLLLDSLIR